MVIKAMNSFLKERRSCSGTSGRYYPAYVKSVMHWKKIMGEKPSGAKHAFPYFLQSPVVGPPLRRTYFFSKPRPVQTTSYQIRLPQLKACLTSSFFSLLERDELDIWQIFPSPGSPTISWTISTRVKNWILNSAASSFFSFPPHADQS